jgi:hypothetical protein
MYFYYKTLVCNIVVRQYFKKHLYFFVFNHGLSLPITAPSPHLVKNPYISCNTQGSSPLLQKKKKLFHFFVINPWSKPRSSELSPHFCKKNFICLGNQPVQSKPQSSELRPHFCKKNLYSFVIKSYFKPS